MVKDFSFFEMQSPGKQSRVARICRKFAAGADQQYIHRLTQTCELTFVV
jgi:hypothetical protein